MKYIYTLILGILSTTSISFAGDVVGCTMEAKMCPNGSYVGRTGPHCEFQSCGANISISTGASSSLAQKSISIGNPNTIFCFDSKRILSIGSKNQGSDLAVTNLQNFLVQKGYLLWVPTGYFGPITADALKAFQKENKLPETGVYGKMTRALIAKETCK